jgi:hypothetical protein
MSANRRRLKIEILSGMADPRCIDCRTDLTPDNIVLDNDAPRCKACAHVLRGERTARKKKVIPLRTGTRQMRTPTRTPTPSYLKNELIQTPPVIDLSSERLRVSSLNQSAEVRTAQIVPFPAESTVSRYAWTGPEMEDRARRIGEWWSRRTGRPMRRKEAWEAASLTLPINDLLTALEKVWRHAKANGHEPKTLKFIWSDLKEAEAAFYKRGSSKPGRGGMKSLSEVLGRRS